jgi:hypothetical protein
MNILALILQFLTSQVGQTITDDLLLALVKHIGNQHAVTESPLATGVLSTAARQAELNARNALQAK